MLIKYMQKSTITKVNPEKKFRLESPKKKGQYKNTAPV